MLAVVKTGGKQYLVREKDKIKIEKLPGKTGDVIKFGEVLLLADGKTGSVKIGKPKLAQTNVEAKILEQGRAQKTTVIKYKPKTRYRRKYGHRQPYTKVEITKIPKLF